MKVAHLTTVDLSLRFLLLPQLSAVIDQGGEALGISAPGPWVEELEATGVRHVPLAGSTRSMNPLSDLKAAVGLWRILRLERPDVLHTHNPKPGVYGRIVGRLAGVPIVVNTVHGLYASPEDPLPKRAVVYLLEALASRFSDAELVQSREDMDLMSKYRITSERKMTYLGNGVDLTRFDPGRFDSTHRERVRRELGVTPDQILVGAVGRLVEEKGYLDLFRAVENLGSSYRLVCVGPQDPDKDDAVDEAAVSAATGSGVVFTGMRVDVDELYPAMDIFVLPSHREGFPRVAMEAAAMGLPVIATDIRGCREVVDHGVNGLLVPTHDPIALTAAIKELGADSPRRSEMAVNSRRRAVERFDEQTVVQTVIDTYKEAARRKGLDLFEDIESGEVAIREAVLADVPALASLHIKAIPTGFLPELGVGFMRLLYRALTLDPQADVLVADDGAGPVGFVAGVRSTGRFYQRFALRYGFPGLLTALPKLARPSVARRATETLRYGRDDSGSSAELLSMAIVRSARGRGLGTSLGLEFLDRMKARGVPSVRVVVGPENARAISVYRKMGFGEETPIEVHVGEPSVELTWRP